ncbi:MAG: hypothetical protein ACKVU1_16615 [bacterium]
MVATVASLAALLLWGAGTLVPAFVLARILGAYLLAAVIPGILLWALFAPHARSIDGVLIALALGPVVSVLLYVAGVAVASSPRAVFVPCTTVSLAAALLLARRIRPPAADERARDWRSVAPLLAALVPLIASLPIASEWWRVRSDAWFHAAFAIEILDFGIPPQDPFFAGLPLHYFWLFHLYLAGLSQLAGSSPFPFFVLINVQALVALVLGLHLLSARFRADAASNRFAVLMGILGLNALFWLFLPLKAVRALIGSEKGGAELARIYDQFPIDLLRWIDFLSPLDGAQPFFLSKFYVGSAFSIGLALAVFLMLYFARAVAGESRSAAPLAAIALAGVWAFHPDVALFLAPAMGLGLAATIAFGDSRVRLVPLRRVVLPVLATVAVTALFAPYLLRVGGREEVLSQLLDVNVRRAVAIAAVGSAFFLLAPFRFRDLFRHAEPSGRFVLFTGVALVLLAMLLRLPGSERAQTMDKNPYFLVLGLALPAGWALADWTRRFRPGARRLLLASAILVPANAAMLFGYLALPNDYGVGPEERALYEWVRRATPRDAIFLQCRDADVHERMRLSVLAPRRVFAGADHLAREWGYPRAEIDRRAAIEDSLFARGVVTRADLAGPASGGPLFVVHDLEATAAAGPAARARGLLDLPVAYESPRYRVYAVAPAAPAP